MGAPFPPGLLPVFRAFVEAVLPPARAYGAGDWARAEEVVGLALADRPPPVRRQIGLFLKIVDVLPVLTHGRRFRKLPPEAREAILDRLQDSPLLLVRRGVWALRTLAFMGHYARPEVHPSIGYGARLGGWAEHPDGARRAKPPVAGHE